MSKDELDDLRVVLVDTEPYSVTTKTVELTRPRRRWREGLLALAALTVVVAVGFLDDGGDGDGGEAAAATTSTTRRTTTSRRATSSTLPRSTTTTSWPQAILGTGPLVPGGRTGSAAAILHGGRYLTVVDLDTGRGCTTDPPGDGLWFPITSPNPTRWVVGQAENALLVIGADCSITELPFGFGERDGGGYPSVLTQTTIWVMSETQERSRLIEHALPSGEETGQVIELPRHTGAIVVAAGDLLVVTAMGEMTLVDPSSGTRRPLGSGWPVAANAEQLAFMSCPELECRLTILDLSSGRRRSIPDVHPVPWEMGAFSRDGRLVKTMVSVEGRGEPAAALIDVTSGEVVVLPEDIYQASFTASGEWLVAVRLGRLVAFHPGSEELVEIDVEHRNLENVAVFNIAGS